MTSLTYDYHVNGVSTSLQRYCDAYLASRLSPQDIDECIDRVYYQIYCIYFEQERDHSIRDLIHEDMRSGQQYLVIEDYSLKVYFQIQGSICILLDCVFD